MISEHYVWLFWSSLFLVPWCGLYIAFPAQRRGMLWASVFTMPFALTEPLFVPKYWNPPSLFDLARTTHFDIESVIFSFGIGGVAAVLYNVLTGRADVPLAEREKRVPLRRHHYLGLAAPFVSFAFLTRLPWNPIYPSLIVMFMGAGTTVLCRPDLKTKTWIGGLLFLGYYFVFLAGLKLFWPGYIGEVWNLDALSGIQIWGLPIEEFLFAISFGMYWSGIYEHFTWRRPEPIPSEVEPVGERATG